MCLSSVGSGEQEDPLAILIVPAELHDLSPALQCRERETGGDCLSEARKIRRDAIDVLRTVVVPAESGDHLIEQEQGSAKMGKRVQTLKIPRAPINEARR